MDSLSAALRGWRAQLSDIQRLTPWALDQFDEMFQRVPAEQSARPFEMALQEWALSTGLYPRQAAGELADAQLGMISCYATPGADAEVRWPIGMYNVWVTSWDDGVVEKGTPVDPFGPIVDRLLRHGEVPHESTPSYEALAQLRQRVIALGGEALLAELADQTGLQFQAWAREQHWVGADELPTLDEYLPHRACTMVTYSTMLLHRCQPGLLPPGTRFTAFLDHIATSTCTVLGIHNDLCGCGADLERDYPLNIVAVIARQYDLDLATAFRCGLTLLAAQWHGVNRLVNQYCATVGADSAHARQARAILHNVHAFHTWNMTAPRQDLRARDISPYLARQL